MNINKAIEKLRASPRDWHLEAGRYIRRRSGLGRQCPAVFLSPGGELPSATFWEIVRAADGRGDENLRARLLDACGLLHTQQSKEQQVEP